MISSKKFTFLKKKKSFLQCVVNTSSLKLNKTDKHESLLILLGNKMTCNSFKKKIINDLKKFKIFFLRRRRKNICVLYLLEFKYTNSLN